MRFDIFRGMGVKYKYYRNWVGMVYASFKKPENAVKKKRKQNFEDEKVYFLSLSS